MKLNEFLEGKRDGEDKRQRQQSENSPYFGIYVPDTPLPEPIQVLNRMSNLLCDMLTAMIDGILSSNTIRDPTDRLLTLLWLLREYREHCTRR